MQTERVTFLTSRAGKAALSARAAARGISIGEYVRRRVEGEDEIMPGDEAELAMLVAEATDAIPRMRERLDQSIRLVEETNQEVGRMLREAGLAK